MQFALLYSVETYDTRSKLMGRQVAGLGFLRAALKAEPERIWCYAASMSAAQDFDRHVRSLTKAPPELRFISWLDHRHLAKAGTLYRPDPVIADDLWRRHAARLPRAYSLCGVTHTLSSHGAMTALERLTTSPHYPWDALICTSTAVRDLVQSVVVSTQQHFSRTWNASVRLRLKLPIILLGVHAEDFRLPEEQRRLSRSKLGLDDDDIAVLFVGRLVFHGKGHPLPMFLALENTAKRTGKTIRLLLCGTFPSAAIEKVFREEAHSFAPSIKLIVLNGANEQSRHIAWSAADIFTSFSDNIQETFGLTPVEAMAAGLPVVVSDWNGYKDTVRDGIDGFRIPTWAPPPGLGNDLADRFDWGIDNYDVHIGATSQFVAVDIEAATEAFSRLAVSPELRSRMGEAGSRRVTEKFEWSVVFRQYVALWDELAEIRRAYPPIPGEEIVARRPDRPDPFTLFQGFPTRLAGEATLVSKAQNVSEADIAARRKMGSISHAAQFLPNDAVLARLMAAVPLATPVAVRTIISGQSDLHPAAALRALLWLAKMGYVRLSTS